VEEQLTEYLATFYLPENMASIVFELQAEGTAHRAEGVQRRSNLERQSQRVENQFEQGDISNAEYMQKDDAILGQLDTLQEPANDAALLVRTIAFPADMPAAWYAASPNLRNELARTLFEDLVVKNDRVEGVNP
jgi:hypothetical protein